MAPCDPYMEPMYWPSPHERLEGMLPLRDGPVTIDVSATPKAGMAHIPQEVMSKVFKYVRAQATIRLEGGVANFILGKVQA